MSPRYAMVTCFTHGTASDGMELDPRGGGFGGIKRLGEGEPEGV